MKNHHEPSARPEAITVHQSEGHINDYYGSTIITITWYSHITITIIWYNHITIAIGIAIYSHKTITIGQPLLLD